MLDAAEDAAPVDAVEAVTWRLSEALGARSMTERGESIGLLDVVVPDEPDARSVAEIARIAHVLASQPVTD